MKKLSFYTLLLLPLLISSGASREPPCSNKDIAISQAALRPRPSGIPSFKVEISNEGKRAIGNIHLHCGMFSSVNLINPKVFKRVANDDCLVNDGKPLAVRTVIDFTYTNSFMFPLSLSKFTCK